MTPTALCSLRGTNTAQTRLSPRVGRHLRRLVAGLDLASPDAVLPLSARRRREAAQTVRLGRPLALGTAAVAGSLGAAQDKHLAAGQRRRRVSRPAQQLHPGVVASSGGNLLGAWAGAAAALLAPRHGVWRDEAGDWTLAPRGARLSRRRGGRSIVLSLERGTMAAADADDWETVDLSRLNLKPPAPAPAAGGKAVRPNSLVAAIEEAAAAAAAATSEEPLDPALREALQGGGADRQAGASSCCPCPARSACRAKSEDASPERSFALPLALGGLRPPHGGAAPARRRH